MNKILSRIAGPSARFEGEDILSQQLREASGPARAILSTVAAPLLVGSILALGALAFPVHANAADGQRFVFRAQSRVLPMTVADNGTGGTGGGSETSPGGGEAGSGGEESGTGGETGGAATAMILTSSLSTSDNGYSVTFTGRPAEGTSAVHVGNSLKVCWQLEKDGIPVEPSPPRAPFPPPPPGYYTLVDVEVDRDGAQRVKLVSEEGQANGDPSLSARLDNEHGRTGCVEFEPTGAESSSVGVSIDMLGGPISGAARARLSFSFHPAR